MRYLSYNINRWVKSSNITKKILATTQKTKIGLLGRSKWNLTNTLKNDIERYMENNEQIKEE